MEYIKYRVERIALLVIILLGLIPSIVLATITVSDTPLGGVLNFAYPRDSWTCIPIALAAYAIQIILIRSMASKLSTELCRKVAAKEPSELQQQKAREIQAILKEMQETSPFTFKAKVLGINGALNKVNLSESMLGTGVMVNELKKLGLAVKEASDGVYIWCGNTIEWNT